MSQLDDFKMIDARTKFWKDIATQLSKGKERVSIGTLMEMTREFEPSEAGKFNHL